MASGGNVEHTSIIRQVQGFLQAHGDARFVWWHRALDDRKQNTVNRAGFKRMLTKEGAPISSNADHHRAYGDRMHSDEAEGTELEYFVLPEIFNNEICKGYNPKMVKKLLMDRNLLVTEGKDDKIRADRNERLPGLGNTRCYRFNSKIMSAEI